MKKIFLSLAMVSSLATLSAQTITYDFAQDPMANGWTSVIDPGSGIGFTYDASGQRVQFDITAEVENNFIHRTLPYSLSDRFCVSFKIHPDAANQNTFFPLLLSQMGLSGASDIHPWRMDYDGAVGDFQNIDLTGVCVTHMEVKFLNRNGNTVNASSLVSFTQPFNMTADTDYWIKLEVEDATHTRLSVYSDAAMSNELRNQLFTTPDLDPFNEIYIANCNGNSTTNISGSVDDYVINKCSVAGMIEAETGAPVWQMYPNPAAATFEINGTENIDRIMVYDMKGSKVSFTSSIIANRASVEISDELVNGVYLVEITAKNGSSSTMRLTVQD
ncbi:MAG TPA: T9SS type A sorting domain-containing protein [Fluviicola sp.]|nr:T9SS type A sorting domain-containing protein [Fluviicola sp.]